MARSLRVTRREFIRAMGATGLAIATLSLIPPIFNYIRPKIPRALPYPETRLVWPDGSPVRVDELEVNKHYIFSYPLINTPNFLINLGDEEGRPIGIRVKLNEVPVILEEPPILFMDRGRGFIEYEVPGSGRVYEVEGVGPNKSIVAYSAICQHFGCPYNLINFYPPGVEPPNARSDLAKRGAVIYCRCHGSLFDPYRGATVLLPPARRPQPFVKLEVRDGELWATSVVGPTIYGLICNTCAEPDKLVGSTTEVIEAR